MVVSKSLIYLINSIIVQAIKRNSQVGQKLVGNPSCVINFYNCASCWKKLIIISMWMQVCTENKTILSVEDIISLIGSQCDGVIGQVWICFSNPLDMFFSSSPIRIISVPPLWLSVRCIFKAITVIRSWIELVCVVDRGLGWNPLCHFEEGWGPCLQQHGCWLQQCWCWSCHSTWHSSWQHPCMLSHLLFRIVKSSVVISSLTHYFDSFSSLNLVVYDMAQGLCRVCWQKQQQSWQQPWPCQLHGGLWKQMTLCVLGNMKAGYHLCMFLFSSQIHLCSLISAGSPFDHSTTCLHSLTTLWEFCMFHKSTYAT